MSSNIIEFPLHPVFEREDFDRCQDAAKEIATDWVSKAENLDQYALALAMASGHALAFMKQKYPAIWEEKGKALETIALGGGLNNDKR